MDRDGIGDVHERWREQVMSDERLLGALPEDAARRVLDDALARLDASAASAASVEAFSAAAETITASARALADAAGQAEDPVGYVEDALRDRVDADAALSIDSAPATPDFVPPPANAEDTTDRSLLGQADGAGGATGESDGRDGTAGRTLVSRLRHWLR